MSKNLDAPETTLDRIAQLKAKPSLKRIYDRNYAFFQKEATRLPQGKLLELGSGAGYLKEVMPEVITSDILPLDNCDIVARAEELPFADGELSAIFMMDVLHHIPDNEAFLKEAERTLKPGGKIIMSEPANTFWGRFIYQNFHHEPFEPEAKDWHLPEGGPLSVANGALPWILFHRDVEKLGKITPSLKVTQLQAYMPLAYLISGGFSYRCLVPDALFPAVLSLEEKLPQALLRNTGMFYKIIVEKN